MAEASTIVPPMDLRARHMIGMNKDMKVKMGVGMEDAWRMRRGDKRYQNSKSKSGKLT